MSKKTVLNDPYRGLVESLSIPAELHARAAGAGGVYASFGGVLPIHCCDPQQVKEKAETTHHYCDIFTDEVLAPLGELAYVRLDENTAEKVFINRAKRILIVSSDGQLAQWRAAPSFESANHYIAGTPIVNKDGALVSIVTARKGNHYAVSTFDGDGGYFESPEPWKLVSTPAGRLSYGDRTFSSREELRAYVAGLPPAEMGPGRPPRPALQFPGAGGAAAGAGGAAAGAGGAAAGAGGAAAGAGGAAAGAGGAAAGAGGAAAGAGGAAAGAGGAAAGAGGAAAGAGGAAAGAGGAAAGAGTARAALVDPRGRQLAHVYLQNVHVAGVDYL